jgi:hypothetical protein
MNAVRALRSVPIALAIGVFALGPATARADDPAVDSTKATRQAQTPALTPLAPVPSNAPAGRISTTTVTSAAPSAPSAEQEQDQTLLGRQTRHGGYGAPETKLTTLTGDAAMLVGAQAGWIIDRHFIIGAAGYGLVTTHSPVAELQRPTGPSRIELGYGGPRIGYIYRPSSLVHFSVGMLIGAGGMRIATRNPAADNGDGGYDHHDSTVFFAMEPQLEAELNVARHVRLGIGGSYRYIESTGKPGLRSSDLSGPAASLAVKIGYF